MTQSQMAFLHKIHNEAVGIAKDLHHSEYRMIEILQKVDENKVYRFLGFKSLYQYANVALKLGTDRAYNFILVARKAKSLHSFQEALRNKEITLSKAKRLTSVITEENQDQWLDTAKKLSQKSLERRVAKANPRSGVQEGTRFLSESVLEFKAAISLNTEKIFKRVQDVMCQSLGRAVTYDEVLHEMAKLYLHHKDPVVKAQRVLSKKIKKEASVIEVVGKVSVAKENQGALKNKSLDEKNLKRQPISQIIEHQLNHRDQGRCQGRDPVTNTICGDSRWTHKHHIIPVSQGGTNILENLITLCSDHHQLLHDNGAPFG
jgi:hypothetical protein